MPIRIGPCRLSESKSAERRSKYFDHSYSRVFVALKCKGFSALKCKGFSALKCKGFSALKCNYFDAPKFKC
jgi:hypothetical protein